MLKFWTKIGEIGVVLREYPIWFRKIVTGSRKQANAMNEPIMDQIFMALIKQTKHHIN